MKIEIYKKSMVGDRYIMCEEVYSMKELRKYYSQNKKSHDVWHLQYKVIEK